MEPVFLLSFNIMGLNLLEIIIGILGFVTAFGLAVFIHELGHFLAAKAFKVPVERFVIGFDKEAMGFLPRCIWEKKWGETVYGLSIVPLGGYVKMSGVVHPDIEEYIEGSSEADKSKESEQSDEADNEKGPSLQEQAIEDMAALYKKPFWQKVIIYAAGVTMNLLLAVVVVAIMYARGVEEDAPYDAKVAWIAPTSGFANTELQSGDEILSVGDIPVETDQEIGNAMATLLNGQMIGEDIESFDFEFLLQSDSGEEYSYTVTLTSEPEMQRDFFKTFFRKDAYIDFVNLNTPAEKGGLEKGDVVLRIGDEDIDDWAEFTYIIEKSADKELEFLVDRNGEEIALKITPWANDENPDLGQIGIIGGNARKVLVKEPITVALMNAPVRIKNFVVRYVQQLGNLGKKAATGNVTAVSRNLSGPAGIAQAAYKMSTMGFDYWMRFVLLLNVALAVMNLLPLPVLDGGHICFAIFEAIFRRPVPPQVLIPLLNGAVFFLLFFFVIVTLNDFWKIFF